MGQWPIAARAVFGARPIACLLILVVGAVVGGCGGPPSEEELQTLFDQGESLCLEARWVEARAVLQEFLLYRPNHAGAHFYLGRTYFYFRPALAEGELQTALELFIEGGRVSPIERYGADYFELINNVESAKVCLLQIDLMPNLRMSPAARRPLLDRAERYLRKADAVMPGTKEVEGLEEAIAGYRDLRSRAFPKDRDPLHAPANV